MTIPSATIVPSGTGRMGLDVIFYACSTFEVVRDFDGFEAYCYVYGRLVSASATRLR